MIATRTLSLLNEKIKKSNDIFAKLSNRKKRIVIAKDVLETLRLGKVRARRGTYLYTTEVCRDNQSALGEALQEVKSCNACALGAVFVNTACRVDTTAVSTRMLAGRNVTYGIDSDHMRSFLGDIFSVKQLHLIEDAFEGNRGFNDSTKRAEKFNRGIRSDKQRLARIMRNIIRNKGTFKP